MILITRHFGHKVALKYAKRRAFTESEGMNAADLKKHNIIKIDGNQPKSGENKGNWY